MKWTKIGSRILIIDVPFKFSKSYFESPDSSSDPRRRLRKFKSGFQFFYFLLIFTSLASVFSTFGEFSKFSDHAFSEFLYGIIVFLEGRYRRYRSKNISFLHTIRSRKVFTYYLMHSVSKILFWTRYRYKNWIGTRAVPSENPVPYLKFNSFSGIRIEF